MNRQIAGITAIAMSLCFAMNGCTQNSMRDVSGPSSFGRTDVSQASRDGESPLTSRNLNFGQ